MMYSFLRQYLPEKTSTILVALVYSALIMIILYILISLGPKYDLRYLNY